jgi:hypothetical protein
MAPLEPDEVGRLVEQSELAAEYGVAVDRESAYELLLARVLPEPEDQPEEQSPSRRAPRAEQGAVAAILGSSVFRSFARSAASAAGREISRSLFGTATRRRRTPRRRW